MSKEISKGSFSSKIGFVLAAAGSAVGLGNIWRFPYLAAKYGGGIFLLVYLILAVTFGFSLMITEIAIGRKTGKSVIGAYSAINGKFKPLGWIAALVPAIILPYYCVIGGWVLKYLTVFISGSSASIETTAANSDAYSGFFSDFIGHAGYPTLFLVIYLLLTAVVVMLGVEKGVEKASKVLMPVLILLTIGVAVYSMTLNGAAEGIKYYLKPDFSRFSLKTVVAAMGQLFYSMSLSMGIMVTYGSYMRKKDCLETSVRQIEIFDTAIAFLSGLMIIPAVFAFSGGENQEKLLNQGPSLMFITLPKVFDSMTGGRIIGIVFFLLVALAALTSSISLMETVVSIVMEKFRLNRIVSSIIVMIFSFAVGMLSVLGYSVWDNVLIFGYQFLDLFDFISNNVLMPIVALLTCILIGYVAKPAYVEEEVRLNSKFRARGMYRVMLKYICPVFMIVIFISSVSGYIK